MEFIKNTFFIVFNIILILIVFSYFEDDISIEEVTQESNPDFKPETHVERDSVYLISYVDGHEVFYRNQNALVKSALNKGVDRFINYRKSDIDSDFYKKHVNILNKKKGAGYWLWKPYIILKTLESMPENAVLIYADSAIHFKKSMRPLIDLAKEHDIILTEYMMHSYNSVRTIATREILEKMDCTSEKCKKSPHIWAGFSVYRNTPKARKFVRTWLDYCSDEEIIFGIRGSEPQDPEYKSHADDQTVLSVLNAKLSDQTYQLPKEVLEDLIIWHHRHPDMLNIPIKFINYVREATRFKRHLLSGTKS